MSLASDIILGKHDDDLNDLSNAIRARRSTIDQANSFEIKVGDKVRFNSRAKPRYLVGVMAVVVGRKQKNLEIQLDQAVGRFGYSQFPVSCPPAILEKVS